MSWVAERQARRTYPQLHHDNDFTHDQTSAPTSGPATEERKQT